MLATTEVDSLGQYDAADLVLNLQLHRGTALGSVVEVLEAIAPDKRFGREDPVGKGEAGERKIDDINIAREEIGDMLDYLDSRQY